ncbi:MAG TPA: lipid-A-disaccharide synthase [Anaeromyxobacteraceae bacterium]|nr:lipid-A-disaccharide synthase [Anaeromyxobacteraceae bacterium]
MAAACYKPRIVSDEILIVAGEASADLHAARALAELRRLRPGLAAFGVGGPALREAGLEALYPAEEICVMGLGEVLPRIPRILAILRGLARAAAERRPRVALLVDLPDFNLRLAAKLKRLGIKVVYYVSPTIWAWRRGRAKKIAKVVDRMLCILPFEPKAYEGTGVAARFVGHPFAEKPPPAPPEAYRAELGLPAGRTTIALVPGSRPSEIARIFPHMLGAAERLLVSHPGAQFVVPVAPTLSRDQLAAHLAEHEGLDVRLVDGRTAEAVGASDGAIVKSGTSTLEAALMQRPMIVVYRVSWLTYFVGRLLVKIAFFSLVNLLAGRRVVPELLQTEASADRMAAELEALLAAGPAREAQLAGLREVRGSLGEPGAPLRVAEEVAGVLAS